MLGKSMVNNNIKQVFTKEIAEQFLANPQSINVREFSVIEDSAAECLSRYSGDLPPEFYLLEFQSTAALLNLSKFNFFHSMPEVDWVYPGISDYIWLDLFKQSKDWHYLDNISREVRCSTDVIVRHQYFTGDVNIDSLFISNLQEIWQVEWYRDVHSYRTGYSIKHEDYDFMLDMWWSLEFVFIDQSAIDEFKSRFGKTICGTNLIKYCLFEKTSNLHSIARLPENYIERPGTVTNSNGMKFVRIPAGSFLMGSTDSEEGGGDFTRQHEVTLTQDFYLGVFPVTQAEFFRIMHKNPSWFQPEVSIDCRNECFPVDYVSWKNAVEFCELLSNHPEEKVAGRVYRLPTEAEWEYACRAGSQTAWCFGDDVRLLGEFAWFKDNSDDQMHPVGLKKPNAWGLYDMHGSVWEWCQDWYEKYPNCHVVDPCETNFGYHRVRRGGAYDLPSKFCRSEDRNYENLEVCARSGFRVVLSFAEATQ